MYERHLQALDDLHAWAIEATRQSQALEGAISAPPLPVTGAMPGSQHWSTVNAQQPAVRKYHISPEALPGAPKRLYVVKQLLSAWEAGRLQHIASQLGITARSETHNETTRLDAHVT